MPPFGDLVVGQHLPTVHKELGRGDVPRLCRISFAILKHRYDLENILDWETVNT